MPDFTKQYPSPVNRDLLAEQLVAAGYRYQFRDADFMAFNVDSEANLDSLIANHNGNALTSSQQTHAHRSGIIEKAALAVQFMPDLKLLLNASVDHDIASATLATRFTSLSGIVDTQVTNAFKNRFNEALKQEQNLDVVAIGLGSLTANQQRTYVTYLRIFLNQYVTLALFGTMQS